MRSLLLYEWKRLYRDRVNLVFLVLIFCVTGVGLWFESITAFQGYRYLHQLVVWWAVFSGYRFAASQRQPGIEEWIQVLVYENKRTWAQLRALYSLFLLCTIGMAGLAIVRFLFSSLAPHVLWQTVQALILYYFLSMLIGGTTGWMLGRAVPQLYGYLLAAVFGYLMGSIGAVWLYALFENSPILQSISPTFGFAPEAYYTALSGYDLSSAQWTKHLLWLSVVLFIANYFYGTSKRKKEIAGVLLMGAVLLGAMTIQTQTNAVSHILVKDYSVVKQDLEPYYDEEIPSLKTPIFQWNGLELFVSTTSEGLKVRGEGTLIIKEPTDTVSFNLQRKFEPTVWVIDGVEQVAQKRGDVLELSLSSKKEVGETVLVRFEYSGIPFGEYTANQSMVVLPNYFNWVPRPETGVSILTNGSAITLPHQDETPVTVNLHWEGDSPYWSNADDGPTSDGVALIAGYINQVDREGITYIYTDANPVAAEKNSQKLIAAMHEAAEELNIPMQEIDTVVALQVVEMRLDDLGGIGAGSRLAGNILYLKGDGIDYPPFQEGDPDRSLEFFRSDVVIGLLLDQPEFLYQDDDMRRAFINAYLYPYTTYVTKYIPYPDLIEFLSEEADIKGFLRAWFAEMRSNTAYTHEDLQMLMKEWNAR